MTDITINGLTRADIKAGETYEFRMGGSVQSIEVRAVGDDGFMTQFGPMPWSNAGMLTRPTPATTMDTPEIRKMVADAAADAEAAPPKSRRTKAKAEAEAKADVAAEPPAPEPAAVPAPAKKPPLTRSQEIAADVAALLRARNPLLWIVTREEARAERYLVSAAAAAGFVPRMWDCGQGVTDVAAKAESIGSADIGETLGAIRARADAKSDRGAWIMRDLPPWLAGTIGMVVCRQVRNLARFLPGVERDGAQALIVLSPSGDVPPELANHATVIEWPMPDRAEIASLLDDTINGLPDEMRESAAPNGTREAAIDSAIGLTGEEAQACYSKSLVQLRKIDPTAVSREKKRVIAREKVLEWFDPIPGGLAAVGGLGNLKDWLMQRKLAYSPAARAYGLPAPKGCFLVGIPGCGKSLISKATATAFDAPLLKLDLGALKGKFVGESEANMRKALRTIEAIGRCVVWIDEIEKALTGATAGGSDGGVSSDQLGALLQWMQERTSESFVIATANSVATLPPELLRKGRFDEFWFVDLPNPNERVEILNAGLKAHGRSFSDIKAEEIANVVAATDGFTGSEIAAIVPDALFAAFADGGRQITCVDLVKAAKAVTPLSVTAKDKIAELRNWAAGKARRATDEWTAETAKVRSTGRALDI
ncbi:AAA family ATPase [Bradyrhizobium septentrionale]|uniref:Uncharacterized AAA domain-containing protein ycf46 n=1 Tax=Bradyrhizobium septentrionale TaxID=1404411 RepID=A0A974A1M2_9BRAD|nr:AAA family ATPase [Bradyrhizobium septentrionale]UGY15216.1 AAA family ATPase [Bradyrhizobium septentrionale]